VNKLNKKNYREAKGINTFIMYIKYKITKTDINSETNVEWTDPNYLLLLILLAGDIEENPGPVKWENPEPSTSSFVTNKSEKLCNTMRIARNVQKLKCNRCGKEFHRKCTGMNPKEYKT